MSRSSTGLAEAPFLTPLSVVCPTAPPLAVVSTTSPMPVVNVQAVDVAISSRTASSVTSATGNARVLFLRQVDRSERAVLWLLKDLVSEEARLPGARDALRMAPDLRDANSRSVPRLRPNWITPGDPGCAPIRPLLRNPATRLRLLPLLHPPFPPPPPQLPPHAPS